MLRHLVDLSERLEDDGETPPLGYETFSRSSPIKWIIRVDKDGTVSAREVELHPPRPRRYRSGKPSPTNLKPYLLVDQARYAIGLPEKGKEEEADLLFRGFTALVREAADETGDSDLERVAIRLEQDPLHTDLKAEIDPRDYVTFSTGSDPYPFQKESAQEFWVKYLENELATGEVGTCSVCREERSLLRTLPQDVSLLGATPQLTSFNESAFRSYGKDQTLNASLCYQCGTRATQALNYLIGSDRHRVRLAGDGGRATLRDQLAVFWATAEQVETEDGEPVDVEAVLAATLGVYGDEDEGTPDEAEVEDLLKVPWHAREAALRAGEAGVHLLVLSPNRGRLIVREWLHESLEDFRRNLRAFLRATRVVGPWGDTPRAFSLRSLLGGLAVRGIDPDTGRPRSHREMQATEVRGLLRTAYSGNMPPASLRPATIRSLRSPAVWDAGWLNHRLIALLKFTEVYSEHEGAPMSEPDRLKRLDADRIHPGYLCGRLLAVLESAQWRASEGQLNTTLVDRNYNAAATAPASTLPRLLNRAETAHIPKVRRTRGASSAEWIRRDIEKILDHLETKEGFPKTLNSEGQGQFALGFYHQRAENRRAIREHFEDEEETSETEEMTS